MLEDERRSSNGTRQRARGVLPRALLVRVLATLTHFPPTNCCNVALRPGRPGTRAEARRPVSVAETVNARMGSGFAWAGATDIDTPADISATMAARKVIMFQARSQVSKYQSRIGMH